MLHGTKSGNGVNRLSVIFRSAKLPFRLLTYHSPDIPPPPLGLHTYTSVYIRLPFTHLCLRLHSPLWLHTYPLAYITPFRLHTSPSANIFQITYPPSPRLHTYSLAYISLFLHTSISAYPTPSVYIPPFSLPPPPPPPRLHTYPVAYITPSVYTPIL